MAACQASRHVCLHAPSLFIRLPKGTYLPLPLGLRHLRAATLRQLPSTLLILLHNPGLIRSYFGLIDLSLRSGIVAHHNISLPYDSK